MMNLSGPRQFQIEDIRTTFFVRKTLDQDHVLYLADLYEHKVKVDPIVINASRELIDGRHRLEAMKLLNYQSCHALISDETDHATCIVDAIKANLKGPLPPKTVDMEHVIELLLSEKVPMTKIRELIPLPPSLIKKYLDVVRKRVRRGAVASAVEAIMDGSTVASAAERFSVDPDEVKSMLSGRRSRKGRSLQGLLSGIEKRMRSTSQAFAQSAKKVAAEYEDGVIGNREIDQFTKRLIDSSRRLNRTAISIKARLEALPKHTGSKAGEEEEL